MMVFFKGDARSLDYGSYKGRISFYRAYIGITVL